MLMSDEKITFSGNENLDSIKISLLAESLAYQKANAEFMILIVAHLGGKDLSSQHEFYKERLNQKYSGILEFLYAEFGELPEFLKDRNIG